MRLTLAAEIIFAAAVAASPAARAQITGVLGVDMVARLTGPGSINNTPAVGIGGTDLGHMVVHQGKTYFLFGDTFSGETPSEGGFWRWNTMAWSTDLTPSDGILFDGWIADGNGQARQVIYSGYQNPITEIPTGAISIDNRIYAWFMSVNWWGSAGQWTINYAGLAYTENLGQTFTVVNGFRLPSNTNFGMVAASTRTDLPAGADPYVYVWGTPSGRFGGVKLARVLPADIANPAAYQYFGGLSGGMPTWVASESSAPTIIAAPVGEMSVMYNQAAGTWMLLYFNQNANNIVLRQAYAPWGPWSGALTVVRGSRYPGLYGSYMNPLYVEQNGRSVYFTMSLWVPYDVYLMRARFAVTAPPVAGDFDADGDVDMADFTVFQTCFNGANRTPAGASCGNTDLDHDGDVDLTDFSVFQDCFNGPNNTSAC